jgi:hypothetical protein
MNYPIKSKNYPLSVLLYLECVLMTIAVFSTVPHLSHFGRNEFAHAQSSTVSAKKNIIIKDELYFGLSKPGGKTISEAEWQQFLNSVITPKFREGLTVMNANGQYLNQNGELIREKTKLVILIYESNASKNFQIQEVVAKYKQRFQQESVLRATSNVKLSF